MVTAGVRHALDDVAFTHVGDIHRDACGRAYADRSLLVGIGAGQRSRQTRIVSGDHRFLEPKRLHGMTPIEGTSQAVSDRRTRVRCPAGARGTRSAETLRGCTPGFLAV